MNEFIGVAITLIATYIGWNGKRLVDKMDSLEKTIHDIIISNFGNAKDIDVLRRDVDDHEIRITQLEK